MALAALKGEKTLSGLAQLFDLPPNQITDWKGRLLEGAAGVFGDDAASAAPANPTVVVKTPHAKIGQLTLAFAPGAVVSQVARDDVVSTSLIYKWRMPPPKAAGCSWRRFSPRLRYGSRPSRGRKRD